MTKQVVSESQIEEITPKTFLRRFDAYNAYIEKLRGENIQSGLDIRRTNDYVPQDKLFYQKIYEKFMKEATSKSGKWNTIISLQESGALSDLDVERFEGDVFPTFSLNRLTRVKSQTGKEYLERFITIRALDRNCNIIQKSIIDADYWHQPVVTKKSVPAKEDDPEDKQIHINITPGGGVGWGLEPRGPKVNLIPYTESKVHEILKQTPPVGSFQDKNNGCSLTLVDLVQVQNTTTVDTIEEFLEPFDIIWAKKRNPVGASVDVKSLVAEMRKQSLTSDKTEAYQ